MKAEFHSTNIFKRFLVIAGFAVGILFAGHELELHLPELENQVMALGIFAPLGFIALFVLLTPLFVSVDALCFAAGLLFPLGVGEYCVVIATYLAAALIFFLGRHLFRERVSAFIVRHERFGLLDTVLKGDELKLMFLLRLTPLPFALLSYTLSVTHVKFWPYLTATSGILIYNTSLVYIGYTTKQFAGLLSGSPQSSGFSAPLLAIGLILLLCILIFLIKAATTAFTRIKGAKNKRVV